MTIKRDEKEAGSAGPLQLYAHTALTSIAMKMFNPPAALEEGHLYNCLQLIITPNAFF